MKLKSEIYAQHIGSSRHTNKPQTSIQQSSKALDSSPRMEIIRCLLVLYSFGEFVGFRLFAGLLASLFAFTGLLLLLFSSLVI